MQSLLAHHNKELQKIQKSKASGSKKIYKPEWCYFHKLHFLRKEIQVNKKKIEKNEERPSTSTASIIKFGFITYDYFYSSE